MLRTARQRTAEAGAGGAAALPRPWRPVGARGRETRQVAAVLAASPEFTGCPGQDLLALAASGRVLTLPAGWTVLQEGTPADACYVLLEGEARVLRRGQEQGRITAPAVVGEMGLLGHTLRTATVATCTPVRALRVEYDVLTRLMAAHPLLGLSLGAVYDGHRTVDGRRARRVSLADLRR